MTNVGIFGKVPTHGDFVARGTASTTARAFEHWLQMANDRIAEAGKALPKGPIGFVYRDEAGDSLLVGTLVASRDSVGRTFPLAAFCEIEATNDGLAWPALVGALTPTIEQLAETCRMSRQCTPAELVAMLEAANRPSTSDLAQRTQEQMRRLADVAAGTVLERIHGGGEARHYAIEVLFRACESTRRYGSIRTPLVLDARATSDVELLFWLACTEAALVKSIGIPATFWDVSARRLLVVLGAPESNTLYYLSTPNVQSQRLWPTATDKDESRKSARARLDEEWARTIETPGAMTAAQFVNRISSLAGEAAARATTE